MTRAAIARMFGISHRRVSQIQASALRRLGIVATETPIAVTASDDSGHAAHGAELPPTARVSCSIIDEHLAQRSPIEAGLAPI